MATRRALARRARRVCSSRQGRIGLRTDRAWLTRLMRDRRGVSAVELGLTAAFILPPLITVFDLGMAFSQEIKLQQAVQAGAQYASMNVWESSSSPTAITNAVTNSLPASLQSAIAAGIGTIAGDFNSDGSVNHSAPYQACYCPTGTSGTYFTSADSPSTCGTTTCSNGEKSGYYVTVSAKLNYTPVAPYSSPLVMNNPQRLTATSVVRIQ
jgi:Flp pilus assembly protein TadG